MKQVRIYIEDMLQLMGRSKRVLLVVLFMGCLLGVMDLTCIALLTKLVAAVGKGQTTMGLLPGADGGMQFSLIHVGIFLIGFYMVRAALGISFNYAIFQRTGVIEAELRGKLIAQFTLMPYEQRLRRSVGSLLTSVNQWTASFARSVLAPLLRCFCDATVGTLILLYALAMHPLTVIGFLVSAVVLGVVYDRTLRRVGVRNSRSFHMLAEEVTESSQQALAGYKEIRVLGLTEFFSKHIHQRSQVMGNALAVMNTVSQSSRMIIESILVTLGIGILLFYAHSGRDLGQELPQLAILTFVVLRVSLLVSLVTSTASNLRLYRGIVAQLSRDFHLDDGAMSEQESSAAQLFNSLEVKQLSFGYEGSDTRILHDLSFAIRAGEAVAIVGESGAGKTTLVDVLLGILKPSAGKVEVVTDQGVQQDLRGSASYLSQNAFLINDTLRRNIALGEADAAIDDAKVMDALRKAKLPQLATKEALDGMLGERGARLSGGQRQRVTLARAFYHGHRVMILDEATNAIDLTTEIEIVQDLLALRPEITLITITHRPEIAKLFPRVLDLSAGKKA